MLPCLETVPMLLWALLASGQIQMRKVDGWETLDQLIVDETLDLTAAKLNPLGEAPKPISTTFETQPMTASRNDQYYTKSHLHRRGRPHMTMPSQVFVHEIYGRILALYGLVRMTEQVRKRLDEAVTLSEP